MTRVHDFGAVWTDQACGMGATIVSDGISISPGRDSLTLLFYSTRAGSLVCKVSYDTNLIGRTLSTTAIVAATLTRIVFADGPILSTVQGGTAPITLEFTEGGAGAAVVTCVVTAGGPRDQ